MAEADLRHVNAVWASPDSEDARSSEFGGLSAGWGRGGRPWAAFTAQAHETGAFQTPVRWRLGHHYACLVRLPGELPDAPFHSNEIFLPCSGQTALSPLLPVTFTPVFPSNRLGLQDWSPAEIRHPQRPS